MDESCRYRRTSDVFMPIGLAFVGVGLAGVPSMLGAGLGCLVIAIGTRLWPRRCPR